MNDICKSYNNKVFDLPLPESSIMSKRKLCMFWMLAKAGRAKFMEVNEEDLSYRCFVWRNTMYFY